MYSKNTFDIYHTAIAFMQANLHKKLRLEDVAKHCCVSNSGLEKNFVRMEKRGVMRCFTVLRLEYAAKKLKEGYTVSSLAEELNFSSSAHFSAAFKRQYGMSPLKYKFSSIKQEKQEA